MTESLPPMPEPAPAPTAVPGDQAAPAKKKLGTGAIVAIVLGAVVLLGLIVVGILFAIAAPIFVSQQAKANDAAAKADVATLGKELATYFVDNDEFPSIEMDGSLYVMTGRNTGMVFEHYPGVELGGLEGTDYSDWCVWVTHPDGDIKTFQYSAAGGLAEGRC